MTIELEPKNVYGRVCYYPLNDLAKAICEVLGRKTLSDKQVKVFKKHHITIQEVSDDSSD